MMKFSLFVLKPVEGFLVDIRVVERELVNKTLMSTTDIWFSISDKSTNVESLFL